MNQNQNQQNPNYYYNGGYPNQPVYYNPNLNRPPMISEEMRRQIELRNKKRAERNSLIFDGVCFGATIIISLIIQVILVLLLQGSGYYSLFETSCTFQNAFNILAVHVASMLIPYTILYLVLKKRYKGDLVPAKKLDKVQLFAWVSLGMGLCLASNYITNGVIELFKMCGYELTMPEYEKPDSTLAVIVVIVSTAIIPGIIEEYAFRCSVLGALKGRGKFFAVLASSIVFGLMHGNVIQFVFAFLVGLVLGYITIKTDSVIPAMLIHGLNNGLSVLSDALTYYSGGKIASYASSAAVVMWFVLSLWGLAYLVLKKELIAKKAPKEEREQSTLSFGAKLLCLLPGLTIPLIVLIAMTAQTVVPIK